MITEEEMLTIVRRADLAGQAVIFCIDDGDDCLVNICGQPDDVIAMLLPLIESALGSLTPVQRLSAARLIENIISKIRGEANN